MQMSKSGSFSGLPRHFFIEFGFEPVDFVTERQPDRVPLLFELDRGAESVII
jgi:hypothetical protein